MLNKILDGVKMKPYGEEADTGIGDALLSSGGAQGRIDGREDQGQQPEPGAPQGNSDESGAVQMGSQGYVYFVETADRKSIKIGHSGNPYRRLVTLGSKSYRLIGYLPAPYSTEQEFHRRFHAFRHQGEWFYAVQPLIEFISTLPLISPKHPPAEATFDNVHAGGRPLKSGARCPCGLMLLSTAVSRYHHCITGEKA